MSLYIKKCESNTAQISEANFSHPVVSMPEQLAYKSVRGQSCELNRHTARVALARVRRLASELVWCLVQGSETSAAIWASIMARAITFTFLVL